jgi:putative hydrolase of the HAD superfamily
MKGWRKGWKGDLTPTVLYFNSNMVQKPYPIVLFDWGDTIMYDDPASTVPMVEWAEIRLVEGITDVLADLQAGGRQVILATGAMVSGVREIRGAFARTGLDLYFSHIYCSRDMHLQKGEAFYRHILADLNVSAADVLMVGDSFEKDVQIPNSLGIFAVWFNQRSSENRDGQMHTTVHSMADLRRFFWMFGP